MKSILVAAVVLMGMFANACPQLEAQFIAQVQKASVDGESCKVTLSKIVMWNENQLCPLDVSSIYNQALTASSYADCNIQAGDTVSGIAVQGADGQVSF